MLYVLILIVNSHKVFVHNKSKNQLATFQEGLQKNFVVKK